MKLILKICLLALIFLSLIPLYRTLSTSYNPKVKELKEELQDLGSTLAPKPTVIIQNGLPNKHQINAAFIPQAPDHNWDQPWQDACEEASLLTVDFYYRQQTPSIPEIKTAILNMLEYETKHNLGHDVNLTQMSQIASEYLNYTPRIIDDPSLEELKTYIVQDVPVIVPASGKILFKENRNFRSGGPDYHNLIILGYDDDRQQFISHDVGTRKGAYFKYSYSTLMDAIHDLPDSHDKTQILTGDKRVLVLLK